MRFIAQNEAVTVVIPGMATVQEAKENLCAVSDRQPLSACEQEKIEKIRKELGSNFCRRCNYCAPCTVGIGIPGVFMMEGYYSRYDLKQWAKSRYDGYDKKASDCIGCGACESRCPYHLPIREMLKKAESVFGY